MILFQNSLVKLNYEPSTDILEVTYPDLDSSQLPELRNNINIIADTVKSYDVKRMLIDASQSRNTVTPQESRELAVSFAEKLSQTRIEKIARLQSPSVTVEVIAQSNIEHLKLAANLPFLLVNFADRETAMQWLTRVQV